MNQNQKGSPRHERRTSRWERAKQASALALGTLALAGATQTSPAEAVSASQPLIIGAVEDSILSKNQSEADAVAESIAALGIKEIFVKEPWTYPRQCAEIKNDLDAFQNAVRAADKAGLDFGLNLLPRNSRGIGHAPVTATEQRCFVDTLVAYEHAFAEVNPEGHLAVEIPNEPNSKTWWRNQKDKDGNWIAPKAVGSLLLKAGKILRQEADKLDISVELAGPGLASNNNPAAFIEQLGKSTDGLSSELKEASIHPYGMENNEPPSAQHSADQTVIATADYDRLVTLLNQNIGRNIPISYSEYGVKTRVPQDKTNLYTVLPTAATLVGETKQAEFYSEFIKMARCQKMVKRILFFNIIDDSDGTWTSGLMYPDRSPKSSYERVKQTIAETESGNYICPNRP